MINTGKDTNKIELEGNLINDIDIHNAKESGEPFIAFFLLATARKQGACFVSDTHSIVLRNWCLQDSNLDSLKKGTRVRVIGVATYKKRENSFPTMEVQAEKVEIISGGNKNGAEMVADKMKQAVIPLTEIIQGNFFEKSLMRSFDKQTKAEEFEAIKSLTNVSNYLSETLKEVKTKIQANIEEAKYSSDWNSVEDCYPQNVSFYQVKLFNNEVKEAFWNCKNKAFEEDNFNYLHDTESDDDKELNKSVKYWRTMVK